MTPRPGIEPGPHWWEASALTTVPSFLPQLSPFTRKQNALKFTSFATAKQRTNCLVFLCHYSMNTGTRINASNSKRIVMVKHLKTSFN